jgi:hypothetical protein
VDNGRRGAYNTASRTRKGETAERNEEGKTMSSGRVAVAALALFVQRLSTLGSVASESRLAVEGGAEERGRWKRRELFGRRREKRQAEEERRLG